MTTTKQRRGVALGVLVASLVAVIIALLVIWWLTWPGTDGSAGRGPGDDDVAPVRGSGSSVVISGNATGSISPGSMVPLDLSLDNTNDFDIAIDQIIVTVRDIDAPRANAAHPCSAADFEVRQLTESGVLTLGSNREDDLTALGVERHRWPAVGMLDRPVNQDGCKGAFLTLGYEASGVEVHR